MKIHFLGTTGYHPNNRRHTLSIMIPEMGIILDAGTGMFRSRELLQTDFLNIFLTHAHLDHSIGLTFLFDILLGKKLSHVHVHGAPGCLSALENHLFHPTLFPVKPPFDFVPLTDSYPLPGNGELTYFPLIHPGGSIGFRLDWPDKSLAFVTDTTATEHAKYIEKIKNVDLLIHECYFPDGKEDQAKLTGHSCLTPVAKVAKKANVQKMYLVHMNPLSTEEDPLGLDSVRNIFPEIYLATDEMVLDF
ncbi:MAG: MBL fold metallo-hydrolase [Pirellulaceae bacterium]|nr:MBL fold metallo-hydrolase [Pirellulaceae bacterium]